MLNYVFISYSRNDKPFVSRLIADLDQAGIQVWIDKRGLKVGTPNWEQALRDAIQGAAAILLVASPNSRKSDYVSDEIAIAKMYERPIFPIWADGEQWHDSIQMGMGKVQFTDARAAAYPTAITDLIRALRSQIEAPGSEIITTNPMPDPDFTPRNPYKGLRAFRETDSADFFGRSRLLDELIETLTHTSPRCMALIGASGSGKSSLVHAGLLPRLRQNALPDSAKWLILPPFVPGHDPLTSLQITLSLALPQRSQRAIREDLDDPSTRGLYLLLRQLALSHDAPVVLFIDQFEELFTQCKDEAQRQHFIDMLVTALEEPDTPLVLLLTLRADFYDRPMHYPAFAKLLEQHSKTILPMTLADLYEVVQRPAQASDVLLNFETNLVSELIYDVRDQVGGLPLLQFTLDQLFQRRQGQVLTLQAYQEIGGVRGALAKHAEATYATLTTDAERELARGLFLRLIEPGTTEQETTRRRLSRDELQLSDSQQQALMQNVVQVFVQARLLVVSDLNGQVSIEVSHEALLREWQRLREWLQVARADIQIQQDLDRVVVLWRNQVQDNDDLLYRGQVLAEALEWAERNIVSVNERAFLDASQSAQAAQLEQARVQAEHQRQLERQSLQRLRLLAVVLLVGIIIAGGLSLLALAQAQDAQNARGTADANALRAQHNAATSDANLLESLQTRLVSLSNLAERALSEQQDSQLALGYARQASQYYAQYPQLDYQRTLDVISEALSQPVQVINRQTLSGNFVSQSPSYEYLITRSAEAQYHLYRFDGDQKAFVAVADFLAVNAEIVWSQDSSRFAVNSSIGTIEVFDSVTGASLYLFRLPTTNVTQIVFYRNERLAVTTLSDTWYCWSLADGQQISMGWYARNNLTGHSGLAWSQTGRYLVINGNQVWDTQEQRWLHQRYPYLASFAEMVFTANDAQLLGLVTRPDLTIERMYQNLQGVSLDSTASLLILDTNDLNADPTQAFTLSSSEFILSPDGAWLIAKMSDEQWHVYETTVWRDWGTHTLLNQTNDYYMTRQNILWNSSANIPQFWMQSDALDYCLMFEQLNCSNLWQGNTSGEIVGIFRPTVEYNSLALWKDADQYSLITLAVGSQLELPHTKKAFAPLPMTGSNLYPIRFFSYGQQGDTPSAINYWQQPDEAFEIWEIRPNLPAQVELRVEGLLAGASWNAKGDAILTWGADGHARVWDAQTGVVIHSYAHPDALDAAAWSPDERYLATIAKNTLYVWHDGQILWQAQHPLAHHVLWVNDELILTWGGDQDVRAWTLTGEERYRIPHPSAVFEVSLAHNSQQLFATRSLGNHIRLFRSADGSLQQTFDYPLGQRLDGISLSPQGTHLLAWGAGRGSDGVYLWNIETGARQDSWGGKGSRDRLKLQWLSETQAHFTNHWASSSGQRTVSPLYNQNSEDFDRAYALRFQENNLSWSVYLARTWYSADGGILRDLGIQFQWSPVSADLSERLLVLVPQHGVFVLASEVATFFDLAQSRWVRPLSADELLSAALLTPSPTAEVLTPLVSPVISTPAPRLPDEILNTQYWIQRETTVTITPTLTPYWTPTLTQIEPTLDYEQLTINALTQSPTPIPGEALFSRFKGLPSLTPLPSPPTPTASFTPTFTPVPFIPTRTPITPTWTPTPGN